MLKNADCFTFTRVTPRNKFKATCTKKQICDERSVCILEKPIPGRDTFLFESIGEDQKPCWMAGRANYFASEASSKYKIGKSMALLCMAFLCENDDLNCNTVQFW